MRELIHRHLDDMILMLFRHIRYPVFPIDPDTIVRKVGGCRYITYDQLAAVSGTDYRAVVQACRSRDGCTQYDPRTDRYLVAINTSPLYGASRARIRWTTAHELGHIAAGHFLELAAFGAPADREFLTPEMEEEADYFAGALLAPIPAMKQMRVKRPADIRDWFGLSQTAAEYRWADFRRQRADERLEDYFHVFRPESKVQEAQRNWSKALDIRMDPWEEC